MEQLCYSDFELVEETETDGFIYGEITDHFYFGNGGACISGDGFVQAPDGSRAGIIWGLEKEPSISVCIEPEEGRWGVYEIGFIKPVKTMDDLIVNFKAVLPLIKEAYQNAHSTI